MPEPFELIEHTADTGIRAFGRTRPQVYENAARGLLSLMASPDSVRLSSEEVIEVEGSDAVDLLVTWLHEILYRFDAQHQVFGEVQVEDFAEWRLRATLRGEQFDPARHEVRAEVKAVTYHAARVERENDGWVAEVLFDV